MRKLGVALVGCGFMGHRHLLGYASLNDAGVTNGTLVAVLDINREASEELADEAAELMGLRPRVYTTLEELLEDEEVEAVDIVTDPRTHHIIANAAMEAGRHVLCEKPLALTIASARTMLDTAERTGMTIATGENYRRGGANRVAKAVIESGMLGKVHLVREFRVGGDNNVIISKWRHMKESGSIGLDMSIHYADILEYLVGPIEKVWGRGIIAEPIRFPKDGSEAIVPDGEDSLFASMRTRDGIDIQFVYLPSGRGRRYGNRSVHGTNGSMEVPADRTDGDVVVYLDGHTLSAQNLAHELGDALHLSPVTRAVLGPDGTGGKGAEWSKVDSGYLAVEIEDFMDAVLNGRKPEVDGVGGIRALAVVHAILESGVAGREVSVDEVLDGSLHTYQDDIDDALESVNV